MLVESGEMVRAWFTLIYCHVLTGVEQGSVVSEKEKKKRTKGLLCVGNYYFCTFPTSISYLWLVLARYMKPIVTADEDNFFRLASFWKISIGLYWYKNKVYFPRFSNILYPNKCKPEIVLFCGLKCKALGMPEMFPGTICVSLCFFICSRRNAHRVGDRANTLVEEADYDRQVGVYYSYTYVGRRPSPGCNNTLSPG